jgi:hypothetical protein
MLWTPTTTISSWGTVGASRGLFRHLSSFSLSPWAPESGRLSSNLFPEKHTQEYESSRERGPPRPHTANAFLLALSDGQDDPANSVIDHPRRRSIPGDECRHEPKIAAQHADRVTAQHVADAQHEERRGKQEE